ncbi:MAG: septum formation initiator family protein [bacterium]|nr:septum formation initiator family protein [Candidatus Kapabacteria bacterium]
MKLKRLRKRFRPSPLTTRRKITLAVLAAIPVILMFAFGNRGLISRVRLEVKHDDAVEHLYRERSVGDSLRTEIARHQRDPQTLERLARERFGMAKPGETIYRVDE